ncbi:MAG: UDP-3-O-(3-hydroxymyristoyl)glucosamine N-acyltransferase [Steroidobacteraceae bacterium]
MLTAQTIKDDHSGLFTWLRGDLAQGASTCLPPADAGPESLVYATDPEQLDQALERKAAILVLDAKLAPLVQTMPPSVTCCFSVRNIAMGMAALLNYFCRKQERFAQWGDRHPTAVVHPSARVGAGTLLGPYCVIGAGASIGEDCRIGTHVVIENGARLGARTVLHAHVFIGADCEVGQDCEIHPHTSIGSDGFGYAVRSDGRPLKIPHLGNVVIGDEVEIGSNCAVDRAKLSSTHIRTGAKLDNICHIAHNCDLGENGMYTAGFMMGGSTRIGRQFVTGGNSVVTSHVTIADNVMLQGRSNVTNDIKSAGAYGGYPLQPLREALKTTVSLGQLNDLRKTLHRLERCIEELESRDPVTAPSGADRD